MVVEAAGTYFAVAGQEASSPSRGGPNSMAHRGTYPEDGEGRGQVTRRRREREREGWEGAPGVIQTRTASITPRQCTRSEEHTGKDTT